MSSDAQTYAFIIEMRASDDVTLRSRGEIAAFLLDGTRPGDPLDAAEELIARMATAGLLTVLKTDLERYIDDVVEQRIRAREAGAQEAPDAL